MTWLSLALCLGFGQSSIPAFFCICEQSLKELWFIWIVQIIPINSCLQKRIGVVAEKLMKELLLAGSSSLFQVRLHDQGASLSNIVARLVTMLVQRGGAASIGSSSVASHVWQQHEQKEDDQAHHHDAKEALH